MSLMPRILVVDDERFNVNVMVDLLKDQYKMMVAKNGEQAINAARQHNPDLILLDIMMPGMDGYEVCRILKSEPATACIPVIFVSAMGDETDETKGLELGAVDYITKPISPAIVKARVKTHLELSRAYKFIETQKNRMKQELDIGYDLQMGMLPKNYPVVDGCSLYAMLRPAQEMSGDFYDFYIREDGHLYLCVGDVSGKGAPAAMFMAETKSLLKSHSMFGDSLAEVVSHVNKMLSVDNDSGMFVTLFIACFDPVAGILHYINAGHQPPLLVRKNGSVERLENPFDPIIGIIPDYEYTESLLQMEKGDIMTIFTDGIIEASSRDNDMYGEERLIKLLGDYSGISPLEMVKLIVEDIDNFSGGVEQYDDITVMAIACR